MNFWCLQTKSPVSTLLRAGRKAAGVPGAEPPLKKVGGSAASEAVAKQRRGSGGSAPVEMVGISRRL